MPSRHARVRRDLDDPVIRIRARYMEAIRAGATIQEATDYANADGPDAATEFTQSVKVEVTLPTPKDSKRQPPPTIGGERAQVLPAGWSETDKPPPLPAVDEKTESVKRPMTAPAPTVKPAPVPPSVPASAPMVVSAPVETQATTESSQPSAPPTEALPAIDLPDGWDNPKTTNWQQLRGYALGLGLPAPNSRTDAIKMIRAKLAVDAAAAPA